MANFHLALETVLEHEGGYVDDPDDPGGRTKYGISQRQYPDVDIQALDIEGVRRIYKRDYWDPLRLDELEDQGVATKVFDMHVLTGKGALFLQRALRAVGSPVKEDNRLGPITLATANQMSPESLLGALRSESAAYLRVISERPALRKYRRGWLRRAYS